MSAEGQLFLVIGGIHLVALVCAAVLLAPALRDQPALPPRDPGSDGGGGQPRGKEPLPRRPMGGLPLPDARPARLRLRDHRRLHELLPGRERRPVREPVRRPAREPRRRPTRQ